MMCSGMDILTGVMYDWLEGVHLDRDDIYSRFSVPQSTTGEGTSLAGEK